MWKWIRIPKGIALVAFLLPWMTISCSEQKIAEATGFGLAFGNVTTMGRAASAGDGAAMNLWLVLALLAIAGGLFLLFTRGREAAKLVLGTSVAALVLIFLGTWRYSKDAIMAEAARNGGGDMDRAAMAMIQVNWEIGYWLALFALIAAAAMAWIVMSGKEAEAEAKMRSLATDAADAAKSAAAKASEAIEAATDKKDGDKKDGDGPGGEPPKA
ncbi:hypothetical protein [Sphingopyxis alaskensis]|jgi:uncharacterized membrane protein YccF (DUF307 family)|uniref:Uncharacterized protein n=1 Tax=Sphingopyxis alaskensis (strain DSM 13593 / LMG 18877 / RB2256) TaxID=317655 RepID=Q1GSB3_SPHAL|nr:hypothetical protein [Sphingopyxis alaskensis]ABF53459.1 hypothetical protein Sala_1746 [Sphingopyxis alaskensis RB2256]MCM3419900.1 hypothetical protein [Sphingopyxis alaskensis]